VSQDFLLQVFFHEPFSPKPLKIALGSFQISKKFAEIFTIHGAPPVTTIPAANFATSTAGVTNTGGKQWEQYQTADTIK
jgi:hypothetical protein